MTDTKTWIITALFILQTIVAADNALDLQYLFGTSPRRDLPFHKLVEYDGYTCENHTVTTFDGYVLTLFRIPLKSSCAADDKRMPIIFMHGLYLSGDDCIIPGPGKAHCYNYADACFDVWVSNVRGNRYSRNHVYMNPDKDKKYWDFALDEMAVGDLPAIIDYVLEITGKKQVTYVSHSQGAALLLILCAKKPEYNAKIKEGFGLSVTAHLQNARLIVLPIQALTADLTTTELSNVEIFAHGKFMQNLVRFLCGLSTLEYPLCSVFIFVLFGYNQFQITAETLQTITGHVPAGSSLKNFARWGQMRKYGFSEIDYGLAKNLLKYGQATPPLIDLSNVTMQWYIMGSENDFVADLKDVSKLKSQLQKCTMCVLPDKTFGHLDFVYGRSLSDYITPKILSVLKDEPFICN